MSSARAGSAIASFSSSSSWWSSAGAAAAGNRLVEDRPPGHLLDVLTEIADGQLLGNRDLALVGRLFADDHPEQGGLAGSVRADEPDLLAGIELERGVDEEDLPAVLLADSGEGNHYFADHARAPCRPARAIHARVADWRVQAARRRSPAALTELGRALEESLDVGGHAAACDALSSARGHARAATSAESRSAFLSPRRGPAASAPRPPATSAARPGRVRWRDGFPVRRASRLRALNVALTQTIDDIVETGQRGIDRVLRDHPRGTIRLEKEADRDVGGGGRRADRIEAVAGIAREQLAMARPSPRGAAESCRARSSEAPALTASASTASASSAARCCAPPTPA